MRTQIEEAVYFLFTWSHGTFNFEPDILPDEQDFMVSINPESLLLEGARRVDEWGLIEKKVPSFDLVFSADRDRVRQSAEPFTAAQEVVLALLDGRRDVRTVVDESGLGEFDVGKALYGLVSASFVRRVGRTRASEPAVSDARVEEHRNLGIAFYRTGMFDEALREFRRVAELRPADPGAPFLLGLVMTKQGNWPAAVEAFGRRRPSRGPGRRPFTILDTHWSARASSPKRRPHWSRPRRAAAATIRGSAHRSVCWRSDAETWPTRTRC